MMKKTTKKQHSVAEKARRIFLGGQSHRRFGFSSHRSFSFKGGCGGMKVMFLTDSSHDLRCVRVRACVHARPGVCLCR